MTHTFFDQAELDTRIRLNFEHLRDDPYYHVEQVFPPMEYDWYGDKEGRALLAFVSHYKISGQTIPCMDEMMRLMEKKTNRHSFFGPLAGDVIHEQQLSGHSWLLRGLCEHYEQFGDEQSLNMIKSIWQHLYRPTMGAYGTYPIHRDGGNEGGVSGSSVGTSGRWHLSTDVGCAFMSIDGLSHAYKILKDADIKTVLDEMIGTYLAIDKVALKAQTHCTLTAARGMMRMYDETNDASYLDGARAIYELYVHGGGMTYTYQNVNWWGRNDTWTEPCAIIDSLMLACQLYEATGREEYRTMAARIYHNGLATAQRANGGAGTDDVVTALEGGKDVLKSQMYEAPFCCTMRLAEGLWYINEHKDLLAATTHGTVEQQPNGTYMDGDILYAEITGGDGYLNASAAVTVDGRTLYPLLKYYRVAKEDMDNIRQRIIFPVK